MSLITFAAPLSLQTALTTAFWAELPAQSKAWTVDQRQAKLMQDVNSGQKSGKLSAEQSKKLREKLAAVARKKAKMKKKANGKLTAADAAKLQSHIDKASSKIKLENRQTSK